MLKRTCTVRFVLILVAGLVGLSACRQEEDDSTPETSQLQEDAPAGQRSPSGSKTVKPPRLSGPRRPGKPVPRVSEPGADPLAGVREHLLERWGRIGTFTAKLTTSFDQPENPEQHEAGQGTRDCLKKDNGAVLVRQSLVNNITYARKGDEKTPWVVTAQVVNKVSDGRVVHIVDRTNAGMTVTKAWAIPPKIVRVGGKMLVRRLDTLKNLRRLDDEMIDKERVYVFEGMAGADSSWHLDISQKTGMLLRFIVESETNKTKFEFALSEIKFDVEFDEDHFVFTPPEGVEIQDLTKPGGERPTSSSQP